MSIRPLFRPSSRLILLALLALPPSLTAQSRAPAGRDVAIGDGISLHVIERGTGEPVVFVHGLLGEASDWARQLDAFAAEGFRAIAYSRRNNSPNKNKPQPGHSAVREAADLDKLLAKLEIEKAHIVGHSYGAYTALFLALKHPQSALTVTLAEPPITPWLLTIEGEDAAAAKAHHRRLYAAFIGPVKAAFEAGDRQRRQRRCSSTSTARARWRTCPIGWSPSAGAACPS